MTPFFMLRVRILDLVIERTRRSSTRMRLLLLLWAIIAFIPNARAQRNFTLTMAPTNQAAVVISWKAQSATPTNDFLIVPQFRVERSLDLKNWIPVSAKLSGSL